MQIKYSPQRSDDVIQYIFEEDIITVTYQDQSDTFDFTEMPDGEMGSIETELPLNPIISAKRVDGELFVELLYYHGATATQEELFPQWHDPLAITEDLEEGEEADGDSSLEEQTTD